MSHDDLHGRPHLLTPNNRERKPNDRNPLDDPNKRVPRIPRKSEDPNSPNKSRFRPPAWVWWILLAGLLVWNILALANPFATGSIAIGYSDFLNQVQAGNVSEVTLQDRNTTGTFRTAVMVQNGSIVSGPGVVVPPTAAPTATSGGTTTAAAKSVTNFKTSLPVVENPTLLPLMQQQNVKVNVKGTDSGGFLPLLLNLLISLLPLALFIGLAVFLGRQVTRGQQGIMGFGKSQARVHDAERPQVTFGDVAGEDEAKLELTEVVDFLKNPGKYHLLGARLPRGVLLVGPPGTGKTLLAKAVAGESGVPFFSVSASEFVEMFVGVGASRVRDLFNKAKAAAPAIVYVDEIDAVGRQRFAGLGGGNDEREQTLNQLLVEMDGFDPKQEVVVLASTNRPDVLDPALLRPGRFDRQVTVGLPDRKGREAILKIHSRGLPLAPDVNLNRVAQSTPGFAGADLANLVNESALHAARANRQQIFARDFTEALDKIVLGTARGLILTDLDKKVVAYHEAGHAVAAYYSPSTDPLTKVSIVPRGRSLGVTIQSPEEDRFNYPRAYLLSRLVVMFGGRASEEIVIGEITTGAESDLKEATSLARRMVGLWGMSEEVGALYLGTGEQDVFLGRELTRDRDYSEDTISAADRAVRELLERSHHRATQLLNEHRAALDALAQRLLDDETLDQEQVFQV
ncbi:MAG: ATP-dependent zinc metalloprotease FtsH, partial [Chloroflexota bacterium]|nr:ATP-dependent zinc metalloprotease FtsH [Chloroflexota bacterium]